MKLISYRTGELTGTKTPLDSYCFKYRPILNCFGITGENWMFRPVNLNRAGTKKKKKKTQKSSVFVITAIHHHVAGHSHVSSHFHFVNRSHPTCFNFFFLASSLLRSLFFFNFSASLFIGFSSFECLVYLVLDALESHSHVNMLKSLNE